MEFRIVRTPCQYIPGGKVSGSIYDTWSFNMHVLRSAERDLDVWEHCLFRRTRRDWRHDAYKLLRSILKTLIYLCLLLELLHLLSVGSL